jgi:hypothetical protein
VVLRWHAFDTAFEGRERFERFLVRGGEIDREAMRRSHMTQRDLREDLCVGRVCRAWRRSPRRGWSAPAC